MKNLTKYTAVLFAAAALMAGCAGRPQQNGKPVMFVSIAPLKAMVEEITGDDFDVRILVPAGASPESFEPSMRQFVALNESKLVFSVGLIDFEKNLVSKLSDRSKIVDLSRGIELIEGECSHHHHGHSHGHSHGVDPHIWSSPSTLSVMARNAYEAIRTLYPDSVKYEAAYERLDSRIAQLDRTVSQICADANHRYFIIYHPALTYLARDYGLEQIAIEDEGKEPGAKRIAAIIDRARKDGIGKIFYQSQFPQSTVATIAGDIGAEAVEIDPLAEDLFGNLEHIARLITR